MVLLASAIYFSNTGEHATAKDVWQQALYYPGIAAMIAAIPVYFVMDERYAAILRFTAGRKMA